MKITLKEVARVAGVSEATASRALAQSPAIAVETKNKVWATAQQLGYKRHLRESKNQNVRRRVVGVVVGSIQNSFFPFLVDKIHNELNSLDYEMILIVDELSNNSGSRRIQSLVDKELDGVIFTTATIGSPVVDMFVERNLPVVLAIRSNQRSNATVVESDNEMAGRDAAKHLLELGHKNVGLILGPQNTSTAEARYSGFIHSFRENGIAIDEDNILWSKYSHEAGYSGVLNIMRKSKPPTALFCANDVIAIGALDAANKLGISVPAQLSILGVDDTPMASWSMIDLTTIRQPINEICSNAVRHLVTQIESQETHAACKRSFTDKFDSKRYNRSCIKATG